MNDVVERVARRLAEENGFAWENCAQDQWRSDARAAIEAMREPSPQMLASVDDEASDKFVARGRAYSAWVSMNDAALADASPDIGKEGIGNDVR